MWTRRNLAWLLAGTHGGPTRARILREIRHVPLNARQIAQRLGLDYTTVRYHLDKLAEHGCVTSSGQKYANTYAWSAPLEADAAYFDELTRHFLPTDDKEP